MHQLEATTSRKEPFSKVDNLPSLAKTFADNVLADPNTCAASTSAASMQCSSDQQNDGETSSSSSTPSAVYQEEPLVIPR